MKDLFLESKTTRRDWRGSGAAKEMNIPVHAIDKNAIHKVSANGKIQNGLPKSTEILRRSLQETGGKK